jgi:Mrp family chromosome partitioning ATPase/predicted Fe-Mo cluster-binding NifX family protein
MNPAIDPAERARKQEERKRRLSERMGLVQHKFIVLSGKGGVGKSTVAALLATALAARGKKVGFLDTDIHGPSVPKLLGLEDRRVSISGETVIPVRVSENLTVMSIGFLLRSKRDAVIWRGPLKMGMIEEFLANVEWGPLDYLIVDSPPGTGDEPLSVCQLIPALDGALVIATPQEIAIADVEKSIVFCGQVHIPVAGVIENMAGFICPHCGERVDVFKSGGAEKMARDMGVPFLGRLPMVPEVVDMCDHGNCDYSKIESDALKGPIDAITETLLQLEGASASPLRADSEKAPSEVPAEPRGTAKRTAGVVTQVNGTDMENVSPNPDDAPSRIALPLDGDRVSAHLGHSARFAVYDIEGGKVVGEKFVEPPPHAPGVIPSWLSEQGVTVVIASGLGRRAISLFERAGIRVLSGAPQAPPRDVVNAYLQGALKTGENVCDH